MQALNDFQRSRLEVLKKDFSVGYQLCLGIFTIQGDLVGWQYSFQEKFDEILMKDTGILPAHQNKGIYTKLLPLILNLFRERGFSLVTSYHRTTNNRLLVPKLKAGFLINGVLNDEYGLAVQLVYPFNEFHRASLLVRSGEQDQSVE